MGIRNYALDLLEMTALQIDFANDRSESRFQKTNDFLSRILIVGNHNAFPFSTFTAAFNQTL